jgi:hypothetical protein
VSIKQGHRVSVEKQGQEMEHLRSDWTPRQSKEQGAETQRLGGAMQSD